MGKVGRFGNKHWIGDVSATGTPLLDGADLGSLFVGGSATREPRRSEFFWQGLELAFGLFDQVVDLVAPGLRIVEGVDHLFECEREFFIAGESLAFGTATDIGGGKEGGRGVFVEPREGGGKIPRDRTASIVSREEIEELHKL